MNSLTNLLCILVHSALCSLGSGRGGSSSSSSLTDCRCAPSSPYISGWSSRFPSCSHVSSLSSSARHSSGCPSSSPSEALASPSPLAIHFGYEVPCVFIMLLLTPLQKPLKLALPCFLSRHLGKPLHAGPNYIVSPFSEEAPILSYEYENKLNEKQNTVIRVASFLQEFVICSPNFFVKKKAE